MPHPTITPPPSVPRRDLSVDDHVEGVLAGDRSIIGRTITLVESTNPKHEKKAQAVLVRLLPHAGRSHRIGITGIPGAGKSTFIEAMGLRLTARGHKLAVLAIDPSSAISGGSILGDKTRMVELSVDPNAFIRPSPSSCTLGGVARKTRETMIVCEAGGFDIVFVETVGIGQSETVVDDIVDFFLVLMVAGAGDELQGIKRGVLELADLIAVNKADGDNMVRADLARRDYATALRFMRPKYKAWTPKAVTCSARSGDGLDALWACIVDHKAILSKDGGLDERRRQQLVRWMWSMVEERLLTALHQHSAVRALTPSLETAVLEGQITPTLAAEQLLRTFGKLV